MRKMVSLSVLLLTVFSISVQAEPWNTFLYGPFETNFNSIHFISSDEGWVVGDGEEVVLHYQRKGYVPTEPSWEDWKVDTTGFPKCLDDCTYTWVFNSVYFISSNEGWIVGDNSDVFHYLNGIRSQVHVPVQGSLMSIYFLSPDEGWVVGTDYNFGGKEKGLILHYHNGFWYQAGVPTVSQGFWMLRSVYFTSSNEGWAVGYKREDSGDYKGVILHYLNGTWNLVNLDLNVACWSLDSVYFISPDEGWAVGWDRDSTGIVLHYLNGTWNRENFGVLGRDWELNSVYFTSPDEGWAVGYDYSNFDPYAAYGGRGIILHYLNGVWSIIDQNLDNLILNSVNFTSPSEGWIAGQLIENKDCNYAVCGKAVLLWYSPPVVAVFPSAGTIGTEITVSGSGFGTKKGKVLVGGVSLKILEWTDASIRCQLTKALCPDTYAVTIRPGTKGSVPIVLPYAFAVKAPEIDSVDPTNGSAGDEITIYGSFFGAKKGKVTLGGKSCKILSWTMDATTGWSEIRFVVPKRLTPGANELKAANGVRSGAITFTVE